MDFEHYTADHKLFREQAAKFFEREVKPHVQAWEEKREFPTELFRKCGEQGYFGVLAPEAYGGSGLDYLYAGAWIEECARNSGAAGVSAGLNMHGYIVIPYLVRGAPEEMKQRLLVPAIRGEKVGALALTEPSSGSDLASMVTTARKDGDDYVLKGSKMFITNGVRADFVCVLCRTDPESGYGGFTFLVVEKGMPGFTVSRKLEKVGWHSSDTAELAFDGVRVPARNVLGAEGGGFYLCMQNLEWERIIMALGSVVACDKLIEEAIAFTTERQAFGRSVSKFQATRHLLANLATETEAARQLVYATLIRLHRGENVTKEAAMCKVFCCEVANRVADRCLQLHGGYGYMAEYDVQRAWRDLRLNTIGGGTTEIMLEIISKLMGL